MQALAARGRVPLLVGGTGLYFRALLEGLSELPESEPAMRAALQAELAARGLPALHAELAAVDPEAAARIKPGDTQRILRALEVFRLSGVPISVWQARTAPRRVFPFRMLRLVLAPRDRGLLHARIEARFRQMLAQGFLDEVRGLMADPRLHPDLPAMRAVGYRQAWRHLAGETDAAAFFEEGVAATRHLAKRQLTWLRGEPGALWFDPLAERAALDRAMAAFLGGARMRVPRRTTTPDTPCRKARACKTPSSTPCAASASRCPSILSMASSCRAPSRASTSSWCCSGTP
jgi:tRNA dimethylallyltransferase